MKTRRSVRAFLFAVVILALTGGLSRATDADHVVKFYATEYAIEPSDARVAAGTVRILVMNEGTSVHGFALEGAKAPPLHVPPGGTEQLIVELAVGAYGFYCPLPGHRERGMEGRLRAVPSLLSPPAKEGSP